LLAVSLALIPGTGIAQDASGIPSAMAMQAHPAHIHSGTCATLGDVVYPLTDLTAPGMMGTPEGGMRASPMAGMESSAMAGIDMSKVISQSTTPVEASLDDILAEEHAINVHESAEKIDVYIACGDLTGTPEDGQLQIDLEELNDSGVEGWAMLMDNGDGTTTVDVALVRSEGDMGAKQEATPSS
jgi:hypothetical protein